jgi:hypothetical protein
MGLAFVGWRRGIVVDVVVVEMLLVPAAGEMA